MTASESKARLKGLFNITVTPFMPDGGIDFHGLAESIERLSDMDLIIGLKQGDLDATAIDQLSNRLGGRIRLFCASDLAFLGPLTAGFDGLSSTNSCTLPEIIRASSTWKER